MWYTPIVRRSQIFIPLVVFFIQSCTPVAVPAVETRRAATEAQGSPAASLTPATQDIVEASLFTPTPSLAEATPATKATLIDPSATPTLTACMAAGGRVEGDDFTTDLLPEPLVYHIYLPPCYDEETDRSYPVLYLVHGMYATDSQWDTLGVPETLDWLVARGDVPPFLVVMPRDRVW